MSMHSFARIFASYSGLGVVPIRPSSSGLGNDKPGPFVASGIVTVGKFYPNLYAHEATANLVWGRTATN
jgi:hypothetical protein